MYLIILVTLLHMTSSLSTNRRDLLNRIRRTPSPFTSYTLPDNYCRCEDEAFQIIYNSKRQKLNKYGSNVWCFYYTVERNPSAVRCNTNQHALDYILITAQTRYSQCMFITCEQYNNYVVDLGCVGSECSTAIGSDAGTGSIGIKFAFAQPLTTSVDIFLCVEGINHMESGLIAFSGVGDYGYKCDGYQVPAFCGHGITENPSNHPTFKPVHPPSTFPTKSPTISPTENPTPDTAILPVEPMDTPKPTTSPTNKVAYVVTVPPTNIPTTDPSSEPTINPTKIVTQTPSHYPTKEPTDLPTFAPIFPPTFIPTMIPSSEPTTNPTKIVTQTPSHYPTKNPTDLPTFAPTLNPTKQPTSTHIIKPIRTTVPWMSNIDDEDEAEITTSKPTYIPTQSPLSTANPTMRPTPYPIEWIVDEIITVDDDPIVTTSAPTISPIASTPSPIFLSQTKQCPVCIADFLHDPYADDGKGYEAHPKPPRNAKYIDPALQMDLSNDFDKDYISKKEEDSQKTVSRDKSIHYSSPLFIILICVAIYNVIMCLWNFLSPQKTRTGLNVLAEIELSDDDEGNISDEWDHEYAETSDEF